MYYLIYIEDTTQWQEDMNFMFEWQEQYMYLSSERSEQERYCFCYENIKFISLSQHVMFFLLYLLDITMTAFLTIFRRFPTTFQRFLKILQNLSEGHTNVAEHYLKMSKNLRRCPKIAEDFRGRSEDVSIIHQRIKEPFRRQT